RGVFVYVLDQRDGSDWVAGVGTDQDGRHFALVDGQRRHFTALRQIGRKLALQPWLSQVAGFANLWIEGVALQQVEAFDIDEQGSVVGRACRFQNANHLERRVFVNVALRADTVG